MTDSSYGNFQTPSSRPPEPPYRSGQETAQRTAASTSPLGQDAPRYTHEPDFSGIDATDQMPSGMGYASMNPPRPQGAYSDYATTARAGAGAHGAAPAKSSGGAGKTFLFGFLGALVACAIAFGVFMAWSASHTTAASASTTIGTSDPTVISAVDDGQTVSEAVAAKALPSVVAIYNYQQVSQGGYGYGFTTNSSNDNSNNLQPAGMGSGVLISDKGYILTNYHVVEGASKLTVKVGDDEREATYIGGDSSSDVAVIKVDNIEGLTVADIGDSDDLVIGEWVMTIGAPLGLEQSVATGVVSATNRSQIMSDSSSEMYYSNSSNPSYTYYPNMIQTDAVINPGNSGGALVDANGKLIGINTMISSYSGDYAGVGFAIPINYAIGLAEQVIEGKEPTHAMLGVSISSVNASNAQRYGLSTTTGAYVSSIAEGTGAAESDLEVGDIIIQVEDTKVSSATDVTLEVREHNPGDTVTVTVNRNGKTVEVPVVLSSDENASNSSNNNSNGQEQMSPNGRGDGYGYGGGSRGYTDEELLRMLGM